MPDSSPLPTPHRFLTTPEAAEYTGLSTHQLDRLRWSKPPRISYYRPGGVVKYKVEDLDAYIESCRVAGSAAE